MIELRRLQAFVTVVEAGNITRAAELLGMQQPPLTRLLRALEAELGVLLLRRLPRGVAPTEAGEILRDEARAVLAHAAEIEKTVRRVGSGEQGRLAVGFSGSAALHPIVPAMVRAFRAALPGVRIALDEADGAALVDGLLQGRLDAAFVRAPAASMPGLLVELVLNEPMLVALPTGHHLATDDPTPLPLASLAQEPFILYRRPSGPGLYDAIVASCGEAGFAPTVAQEAPRLPATLSLVAAGLGLTLVPESMRRMAIAGVAYRRLGPWPHLSAPLNLALRRTGTSAAVARFRAMAHRLAADDAISSAGAAG